MARSTDRNRLFPNALQICLHGNPVGFTVRLADGRNQLLFSPEYLNTPASQRHTFTLAQLQNPAYLTEIRGHHQRLDPSLSNLLPEGVLMEWYAQHLKIALHDEFALLAATGRNLAGAITAELYNGPLPDWVVKRGIAVRESEVIDMTESLHFSLSGVQMKFSGTHKDGRFVVGDAIDGEQWILKTPSTIHAHVPANEYTAMRLAEAVGVEIPEIRLISLSSMDNLPDLQLPDETDVYAVKRFDRQNDGRPIHTEDFAQVFSVYPHEKYGRINYEQIGRVLLQYSTQGLADVCEMARRLLVNILLANGDAHIKNWSLIYPDGILPKLVPAYDIVSTLPYIATDKGPALNMAREKDWQKLSFDHFRRWADRIGAPWPPIQAQLQQTLELAKEKWQSLLNALPMDERQKDVLKRHWQNLHEDLRLL